MGLIQNDKILHIGKHMFEEESTDKLKHVKCYIKEVNNNIETDVKVEPKSLLFKEKVEIESKTVISRPSIAYGFPNPFQPEGLVSEDADRMIRMWKEDRLAEVFEQEDVEQEDEEDPDISDEVFTKDLNVNFVPPGNFKTTVEKIDNNTENRNKREKLQRIGCSVM